MASPAGGDTPPAPGAGGATTDGAGGATADGDGALETYLLKTLTRTDLGHANESGLTGETKGNEELQAGARTTGIPILMPSSGWDHSFFCCLTPCA